MFLEAISTRPARADFGSPAKATCMSARSTAASSTKSLFLRSRGCRFLRRSPASAIAAGSPRFSSRTDEPQRDANVGRVDSQSGTHMRLRFLERAGALSAPGRRRSESAASSRARKRSSQLRSAPHSCRPAGAAPSSKDLRVTRAGSQRFVAAKMRLGRLLVVNDRQLEDPEEEARLAGTDGILSLRERRRRRRHWSIGLSATVRRTASRLPSHQHRRHLEVAPEPRGRADCRGTSP